MVNIKVSSSAIALVAIIMNPLFSLAFKSSNRLEMRIESSGAVLNEKVATPSLPSDLDPVTFLLVDSTGKKFSPYNGKHANATTTSAAFSAPFDLDVSGIPIEPSTKKMVDPVSLMLFDNSTGVMYDPNTGTVLEGSIAGVRSDSCSISELNFTTTTGFSTDPSMNWPVSLTSGELKNPNKETTISGSRSCGWKQGYSTDSSTGFRIDSTTGLPTDPYSNCPFNPVSGNLVNRSTGKTLPNTFAGVYRSNETKTTEPGANTNFLLVDPKINAPCNSENSFEKGQIYDMNEKVYVPFTKCVGYNHNNKGYNHNNNNKGYNHNNNNKDNDHNNNKGNNHYYHHNNNNNNNKGNNHNYNNKGNNHYY
ncbi:uncharacterized protein cubi_03074 [Cryptosporidium ubiquitum]|uniref:Uncharacterized protein n=1 Tax=Cryptosporidium ubiquitum TaxID=857276 RepID=A0A1J4MPQ3_9CRYT|nr:uncharacterized protein cubi_03074 [Cryptosporidium ubiquitum]OII74964.1 hypothetical protein cubi_03074 [Cryptosporidium ubiquitum]